MVLWLLVTTMVKHALEGPLAYGAEIIVSDILHGAAFARTVKSLGAVAGTFKNAQFRRFVYADVIYFFAVTLFQTGLADFETKLMGIPSDNTFTLTVIMTVVSLSLYPVVNKLAPRLGKKNIIITLFLLHDTTNDMKSQ